MAAVDIDVKTLSEVRNFLSARNSNCCLPPKPGAFQLFPFPAAPKRSFDLVCEGIYLGDASLAKDVNKLKSMGITHVINASHGTRMGQINTSAEVYRTAGIDFHGIPALDIMTYDLLPHLRPAADFIHQARQQQGVVYVHCQLGVSRSATVVLAYMMIHLDMPLTSAVRTLRDKREVHPNEGFLKQLCVLDKQLRSATLSTN